MFLLLLSYILDYRSSLAFYDAEAACPALHIVFSAIEKFNASSSYITISDQVFTAHYNL